MDSPGGPYGDDSPARALAGPSRSRRDLRQRRSTLAKPYGRPSMGTATNNTSTSALDSATASPSTAAVLARQRHQNAVADASTSPVSSLRRRQSNASLASQHAQARGAAAAKGGILSSLRDAIFSRPLAWLQRGAPSSDVLPTTSEPLSTLPASRSRRTSGTLTASSSFAAPAPPGASTSGRAAGSSSALPSSTSAFATLSQPSHLNTPRPGQVYNVGIGQSRFGTPHVGGTRATTSQPRSPSPARSSASAAIAAHGRQRLSVEPSASMTLGDSGSILSTPGYRRGISRNAAPSVGHGSAMSGQSSTSFAYGFGSERRVAGISSMASATPIVPTPSRLTASASYGRLPSRSPFAMQRMSGRSSMAGSDAGTNLRSPLRPATVYGGEGNRSRAGSNAGSATSSRVGTPRRREWSSLKIAPPTAQPSEGERLMQEYMAMRQGQGESSNTVPAALKEHDFAHTTESVGPIMDFDLNSQVGSLKRDISMSVDGRDAAMSDATSRKRQMLWDPELGFVSRQDLRAAQPQRPVAQNEAERLLNALEGMKSPARDARRGGSSSATTSKSLATIKVPLHVSARSDLDLDAGSLRSRNRQLGKTVSPYSRAMRQSRIAQSAEPESNGLRSRLKRPTATHAKSKLREQHDDAMSIGSSRGAAEVDDEDNEEDASDQDGSDFDEEDRSTEEDAMEDEDDDDIIEPPRRKVASKVPSKPAAQPTPQEEPKAEGRTLRSGKVLPPSPPKPHAHFSSHKEHKEAAKPMSRARISLSTNGASSGAQRERAEQVQLKPQSTSAAFAPSKDTFKVGGGSVGQDAGKGRSSLRQGAEKTSRSHVKSGRIGLDDEGDDNNEDDEGPTAAELDKIKLPTNLFPSGFAFTSSTSTSSSKSATTSAEASAGTKAISSNVSASPAPAEPTGGGSSLLSRMGGFAPQQEASTQSKTEVSKPTFTFTAPSSTSSTSSQQSSAAAPSKPAFSFQPAISSPLAAAPASDSQSGPSSTSSSSFFTAPPAKTAPSAESKAKNDGPVPNFFASALSKDSSDKAEKPGVQEPAKPAATPSFSFTTPASTAASSSTSAASVPTSGFSFGKPAESSSSFATKQPAFSFGNPASNAASSEKDDAKAGTPAPAFGGFGAPSTGSNGFGSTPSSSTQPSSKTAASPFSFGAPAAPSTDKQDSTTPSFSGFGQSAPSSATSSGEMSKKRGMDDSDSTKEGDAQKKVPSFSFGTPASSTAASPGFNFGAPKSDAPATKSSFSFGAPASSTPPNQQGAPASAPSGTPAFGGFGTSSSTAPAASKPAFTFGAPAPSSPAATPPATSQSSSGFNFGAPKPNGQAPSSGFTFGGPTAGGASTSSTPFGQSVQASSTPAFGASTSGNAAQTSGGFGSSGFGSQDSSRQASPAPFTFGATNGGQQTPTTPGGSGFGNASGGFGQSQSGQTGQTTGGFSFGAPSQPQQGSTSNATGAAGGGSPFSFSMPMSGAAGGFGGTGGFGQGAAPSPSAGSSSAPFVFGAPGNTSGGSGMNSMGGSGGGAAGAGFTFGSPAASPAPGAADMSRGGGGSNSGSAGGSLFNIGAPSSSANNSPASGNRVVRGMPARRRRP